MSSRVDSVDELSAKQRLCIFHGTSVTAERALGIDQASMTFDLLRESKVTAENLVAAGVGPRKLKAMGMTNMDSMRDMGFDALHMADPRFVSECVTAFGSESVLSTFPGG